MTNLEYLIWEEAKVALIDNCEVFTEVFGSTGFGNNKFFGNKGHFVNLQIEILLLKSPK